MYVFKKQLNIGIRNSCDMGRFMENFRFDTICNITQESGTRPIQEPQEDTFAPAGSQSSLLHKISPIAVKKCMY